MIAKRNSCRDSQRRKMVRQSLKTTAGADTAMEVCGTEPTRQAEALLAEGFVGLVQVLDTGSSPGV